MPQDVLTKAGDVKLRGGHNYSMPVPVQAQYVQDVTGLWRDKIDTEKM